MNEVHELITSRIWGNVLQVLDNARLVELSKLIRWKHHWAKHSSAWDLQAQLTDPQDNHSRRTKTKEVFYFSTSQILNSKVVQCYNSSFKGKLISSLCCDRLSDLLQNSKIRFFKENKTDNYPPVNAITQQISALRQVHCIALTKAYDQQSNTWKRRAGRWRF